MAFVLCPSTSWRSQFVGSHLKAATSNGSELDWQCSASLNSKSSNRITTPVLHVSQPSAEKGTNEWEDLKSVIPFQEIRNVSKPGQYLGNEFGAVNKPWNSVKVRFCLAYPDLYSIGMSSTGHIVLYSCLNEHPDILCDRSYLPAPDMQKVLHKYNLPIFAVESKRPLSDFDIIGMSLMYELGATNCVKVMEQANIPCTWTARDAAPTLREGPPLMFAGGRRRGDAT
ncbi:hypothetical protein FGB62_82g077 [Gracilaria domingensis]|nr:hypothetical protein FGB62_82g077 [Gracilaria domingensis]